MFDLQLNESGSRRVHVTAENLETIRKYSLFDGLVSSPGYVTENEMEVLRQTTRSLIANSDGDCSDLLALCVDIIYHDKMKAFGLKNLIEAYNKWERDQEGDLNLF